MTTRIDIPANETGIVRLFAFDLPDPAARAACMADPDAAIAALGAAGLDPEHVDLVDPRDLDDLGLSGLLTEGHGVREDEIAPLRARLDALPGPVLIVGSRAFGGRTAALAPGAPLRWIATLHLEPATTSLAPLRSASASGVLEPGGAADPHASRTPRALILLLLGIGAVLLVGLVLALGGRTE